jgi:hypothetical protein
MRRIVARRDRTRKPPEFAGRPQGTGEQSRRSGRVEASGAIPVQVRSQWESRMPIDFVLVGTTAQWLANYVGLVEDRIQKQLIALANSEFEAGYRALQQADRSDVEQQSLLQEARNRFNKALSLEVGHRLALSLMGLALCHLGLGDRYNANVSLLELISLDRTRFHGFWGRTLGRELDTEQLELQRSVREYLFGEYRYAVPIGDGVYDFRLVREK